jgi:hypothetical protein
MRILFVDENRELGNGENLVTMHHFGCVTSRYFLICLSKILINGNLARYWLFKSAANQMDVIKLLRQPWFFGTISVPVRFFFVVFE